MRDRLIAKLTETFDEQYEKRMLITPQYTADSLLADGWIRPPCKVGDTVYRISTRRGARIKYIQKTTVSRIAIDNEGIWIFCTCNPIAKCIFGKTVFLFREEAEAKLKEGEWND